MEINSRIAKAQRERTLKVNLHWDELNAKANVFLWSLLNVNIKLDSLWIHQKSMSLSLQYI